MPIDTDTAGWSHFAKVPLADTDGMRIYAIGDIHGNLDQLVAMNAAIENDRLLHPADRTLIVYLGDLIDRGSSSSSVIEFVRTHRDSSDERTQVICLSGNHDAWLFEFLSDAGVLPLWARKGGLETLQSYGFEPEEILTAMADPASADNMRHALLLRMPVTHQNFLTSLALYHRQGDYFFAHAGIDPNTSLAEQNKMDLTWIRDPFLNSNRNFGVVVVHGHTSGTSVESLPNRINVDTGVYATQVLSCVVLDGTDRHLLTIDGRKLRNRRKINTGPA